MARENKGRRLAAILSADVIGYSRLMGMDESGTLDALRAHRAEHAGIRFHSENRNPRFAVGRNVPMRARQPVPPHELRSWFRFHEPSCETGDAHGS